MKTNANVKKIAMIAMLSTLAYIAMYYGRIPVILFLKYDPKDVIITIGGFLFGPLAAFFMSAVVSFLEMIFASDTGPIGWVMNVLSSCAFACTASVIYKKKRSIPGAVIGLITACLLTTAVMILWNYLIVPIYMNRPRAEVVELLIPAFLPFNMLKGGLNAAITMLLYKHVSNALRRARLLPQPETTAGSGKINIGVAIVSIFVIITCVLFILVFKGII